MSATPRLARSASLALAATCLAPAALTAFLLARHAEDVPVWDDLERATLFSLWKDGRLDLDYLYSLHIEHRILVPRLLQLANARFLHGSLVTEHWATFAIVAATALCVHGLLRRSFAGQPAQVWRTTALASGLLFSPLQWETFLWAIQLAFVVSPGALAAGLWVLGSRASPSLRFAGAAAAALVATHSFSSGIALWPVLFAAGVATRRLAPRAKARFAAAWLLLAALVLVPYFTVDGFRNRSDHAYQVEIGEKPPALSLATAPARAERIARFYLAMLGSPLARTTTAALPPRALAPWLGAALLAAFAGGLLYWLARWRDDELWERGLPWVTLGGFSLALCAAAAVGRSSVMSWYYSLIPHYATLSLWLIVALLALVPLVAADARRRLAPARPRAAAFLERAPALLAGALVAALLLNAAIGAAGMREWQSARLQARSSLLFLRHFEPLRTWRFDGVPEIGRRLAERLDRTGFLHPPMLADTRLARFAEGERLPAQEGRILRASVGAGVIALRGFAWLGNAGRRADAVLLVARAADGEQHVLALAELRGLPVLHVPEQDHIFNEVHLPGLEDFSPWRGRIRSADLPPGAAFEVEAYALDSRRMQVHRLVESLRVRRTGSGFAVEIVGRPPEPD